MIHSLINSVTKITLFYNEGLQPKATCGTVWVKRDGLRRIEVMKVLYIG